MFDWDFVLGFGLLLTLVAIAFLTTTQTGCAIWRWLKGSRKTYYVIIGSTEYSGNVVSSTDKKFRTSSQRGNFVKPNTSVIEVNRGPFRRRSAIYGPAAKNWKITRIYRIMIEVDCVELEGGLSVPVETALRLINTYSSLQAMLDRIAELEKELKSTEAVLENRNNRVLEIEKGLAISNGYQEELFSGVCATLLEIMIDRQKSRSPAAMRIRKYLEAITAWAEQESVPFPPVDKIMGWKKRFHPRGNEENIKNK